MADGERREKSIERREKQENREKGDGRDSSRARESKGRVTRMIKGRSGRENDEENDIEARKEDASSE